MTGSLGIQVECFAHVLAIFLVCALGKLGHAVANVYVHWEVERTRGSHCMQSLANATYELFVEAGCVLWENLAPLANAGQCKNLQAPAEDRSGFVFGPPQECVMCNDEPIGHERHASNNGIIAFVVSLMTSPGPDRIV